MSSLGGLTPQAWLDAHVNLETGVGVPAPTRERGAPTLERIGALLQYLGSPQLEYPAIQLTGTNGKTTTTRMIAELLSTVGYSAGAYTSPHLQRVNERIARNDELISDTDLDEQLRVVAVVEAEIGLDPSYFEVVTGAALSWFADIAVDVAVVEVGLGGTWDATNVIDADVAVVTNVSIDHVQYLGDTPEKIAIEKAGIVKPGSTLVLGETDPDLVSIFEERGAARVVRRDIDFGTRANVAAVGGRMLELFTTGARYPEVFVPLYGAHQGDNAAIALAAAEAFVGAPLAVEAVYDAFTRVRSPGRLEIVGRHPLVLLDGAHNVAGAQALRTALSEEFAPVPRTLVIGLLRERNALEMLTALGLDEVAQLVCARPPNPRAMAPQLVAEAAIDLGFPAEHIDVVDTAAEAVSSALLSTPAEGEVVITGSLSFIGAARGVLVHS
ncbi:MAG: bifunctional folylpolyglutamate synthase/dihydrofolate synthase [Acidimicrobiia bacterium]